MNSRTFAYSLMQLAHEHGEEKAFNMFQSYLKQKNLVGILPQVLRHLHTLEEASKEENILSIRSKYELSQKDIESIKKITNASKETSVKTEIDPHVIGGFSASFKGYLYDGSLEHTLDQFKKALAQ